MSSTGNKIRRLLKLLERESSVTLELREWAKTEGGRLNAFGSDFIALAAEHEIPQAVVARILDITPAAVSRRYKQ